MNNQKRWLLTILFPFFAVSMSPNQQDLYDWARDEIGKKWLYHRIIPLGLVAWAGYEYMNNGCADERCRNAMSPLIIAGILVGKQHLYKLARVYKKGNSPQHSPRK